MNHLDVGKGGLTTWAPVDHALATVDLPFLVEANEDFAYSTGKAFIEGEPLPLPIGRGSERLQLPANMAAVAFLPVPDTLHELFATKVVSGESLLGQFLFHDVLGSDPCMIHARKPTSDVTIHPLIANYNVV